MEPKNVQAKPEKPVIGAKLEARKKQGTITLVTPPSFFQNQNRSFCLINLRITILMVKKRYTRSSNYGSMFLFIWNGIYASFCSTIC